jgi:hypothetical protein
VSVPVSIAIAVQRKRAVRQEAPTIGSGLIVRHEWWVELALARGAVQAIDLIALWHAIGVLVKVQHIKARVWLAVPSTDDLLVGVEQNFLTGYAGV